MATITGTSGNDTIYPNTVTGGVTGGLPGLDADSIQAGDGNDSVFSSDGNDTLRGGGGADRLFGGNGNDLLFGDSGDDRLFGNGGDDIGDGGSGFDVVAFDSSNTLGAFSVTVNNIGGVNTAISTGTVASEGSDTYTNIEAVAGSRSGDTIDIVSANTASFTFHAFGGAGNDSLIAPAAADRSVFADYRSADATTGAWVDLAFGIATDGQGGVDTIANFVAVRGTDRDDTLLGSAEIDRFRGRGGNDLIAGRDGFDISDYSQSSAAVSINLAIGRAQDGEGGLDTLTSIEEVWGTTGNDTMTGSAEDELFVGFSGNDTIDGAGGQDRATYSFSSGNASAGTQGIVADLVAGTVIDAWGGTDTLISIERISGTGLADSMRGGAEANRFRGRGGNDTLDGGLGGDYAEYINATAGATVNLTTGAATDGEGGTDLLIAIENVIGGNHADRLTGVAQAGRSTSLLRGGGGNDTLVGINGEFVLADYADQTIGLSISLGAGNANDGRGGVDTLVNIRGLNMFGDFADTLLGTAAAEWFNPSQGADSVNAGLGFDIVSYAGSDTGGVSVSLLAARARDTGGATDTILGFEGVSASFGDDTIVGNALGNLIGPGAGADSVSAGAGQDTVSYSLGFTPEGTQYGANEAGDRLTVLGVTIDLLTQRATDFGGDVDTILSFEHAIGGTSNDIVRGNGVANFLGGAEGNDTIEGRAGADTLDGGTGNDRMLGGLDADTYIVDAAGDVVAEALNQGIDTVRTSIASYVLGLNVENLVATSAVNHTFTGNALNNVITGSGGADTIYGGLGNDTVDGGAGIDRLLGGGGNDRIIVTAGDVVFEALNQGDDTVESTTGGFVLGANLEHLVLTGTATTGTGNTLANTITGNALGNILNGMAGNDTIDGGGGTDYLIGGTGQDVLTGGGGIDRFRFAALADSTVAAPDVIVDFNHATEFDRIELNLIDANATLAGDQAFVYRGAAFTGAAGDLRVQSLGGNFYLAGGDVNGDGTEDFAILIQSASAPVSTWFVL